MNKKHQNLNISSLLGRESSRSSETSYECERGVDYIFCRVGEQTLHNIDRATECAMTDIGKNDKNTIKQNQPSCLAALSQAALSETNHSPKQKTAFTLAEVLITLGIIGVVAALTIPFLYTKYQQKVTEVRFERVYSDLTKAFNAGAIENGEEYFMQSWQMSYSTYIEYVYQNYLKQHIHMMDVVTYGDFGKKYKAKNPEKAFWNWSGHIFIIDRRTFISFDSDAKTINVVLLNNDKFDFSDIKDGVNIFSLGTPFCCNNDKCVNISNCPNHNLKSISAWTNYSTEKLVELCKEGKDVAWVGGKRGFCTQALVQNGFKFPKGYLFK